MQVEFIFNMIYGIINISFSLISFACIEQKAVGIRTEPKKTRFTPMGRAWTLFTRTKM